jgi:hypothetical protein
MRANWRRPNRKVQLDKIPAAEQQLQSLIRDRTTYEQTYEQLAQRQTTAIHSVEVQRPPAEVVSPALPPATASFPDKKLLTLTGLALGVFFAVLILMPRPDLIRELPAEPVSDGPEPHRVAKAAALDSIPASERASELPREGGALALSEALKKAKRGRPSRESEPSGTAGAV